MCDSLIACNSGIETVAINSLGDTCLDSSKRIPTGLFPQYIGKYIVAAYRTMEQYPPLQLTLWYII